MSYDQEREDLSNRLERIATADCAHLMEKRKSYGESWRKRGGVGAYMMLARKWDRIEKLVEQDHNYDIFEACHGTQDEVDGILDDIGDLRRYLLLVEEFVTRYNEEKEEC